MGLRASICREGGRRRSRLGGKHGNCRVDPGAAWWRQSLQRPPRPPDRVLGSASGPSCKPRQWGYSCGRRRSRIRKKARAPFAAHQKKLPHRDEFATSSNAHCRHCYSGGVGHGLPCVYVVISRRERSRAVTPIGGSRAIRTIRTRGFASESAGDIRVLCRSICCGRVARPSSLHHERDSRGWVDWR
jgi:hypothetical protein